MLLSFIVFNSGSKCPNHNVIIKTVPRKFGILHGYFYIKWCAVFDWKRTIVYFSQNIYVFLIYFTKRNINSVIRVHRIPGYK